MARNPLSVDKEIIVIVIVIVVELLMLLGAIFQQGRLYELREIAAARSKSLAVAIPTAPLTIRMMTTASFTVYGTNDPDHPTLFSDYCTGPRCVGGLPER